MSRSPATALSHLKGLETVFLALSPMAASSSRSSSSLRLRPQASRLSRVSDEPHILRRNLARVRSERPLRVPSKMAVGMPLPSSIGKGVPFTASLGPFTMSASPSAFPAAHTPMDQASRLILPYPRSRSGSRVMSR